MPLFQETCSAPKNSCLCACHFQVTITILDFANLPIYRKLIPDNISIVFWKPRIFRLVKFWRRYIIFIIKYWNYNLCYVKCVINVFCCLLCRQKSCTYIMHLVSFHFTFLQPHAINHHVQSIFKNWNTSSVEKFNKAILETSDKSVKLHE